MSRTFQHVPVVVLVALVVCALGVLAGSAFAESGPVSCATPSTYTGTDPVATAVSGLDADVDQDCAAVTAAVATGPATSTPAAPSGVQTVALDAGSEQFADGEAAGLHEDLWVIVGVVVGAFVMHEVLSRVFP